MRAALHSLQKSDRKRARPHTADVLQSARKLNYEEPSTEQGEKEEKFPTKQQRPETAPLPVRTTGGVANALGDLASSVGASLSGIKHSFSDRIPFWGSTSARKEEGEEEGMGGEPGQDAKKALGSEGDQEPADPIEEDAPLAFGAIPRHGDTSNLDGILDRLNTSLNTYRLFRLLSAKSGLESFELLFGILTLCSLIVLAIFGPRVFVNCIAFLYPAYASYKVLERSAEFEETQRLQEEVRQEQQHASLDKALEAKSLAVIRASNPYNKHLRHWLTFWTCYGCFQILEVFSDYVLYWMAYYRLLKLIILVWLFFPRTNPENTGCAIVYEHVVRPALKFMERDIDRTLNEAAQTANEATTELTGVAGVYIKAGLGRAFRILASTGMKIPLGAVVGVDDEAQDNAGISAEEIPPAAAASFKKKAE
jgi:receptor expression-enhancing protein 5/6